MNIVVFVTQVPDTRLPLEITPQGVVSQREPWPVLVLNPADRCALEEAMRIRSSLHESHVTAITVGPPGAEGALVPCLARGVDNVVHLLTEGPDPTDSFAVARALASEIERSSFDLVLCGDQTLDNGVGEVGPVLAELLAVAQVTGVVKMMVLVENGKVLAERKLERGYRQTVEARLPALVAVDVSICQPRYLTARSLTSASGRLEQCCRVVCLEDESLLHYAACLRKVVRVAPPRPRTKRIAPVDTGPALLDGAGGPMRAATRSDGSSGARGPEGLSEEIIAFLQEKGVLTQS